MIIKRLLCFGLIAGGLVQAQVLQDPTQPPKQAGSIAIAGQPVQDTANGVPSVTAIFIGPQRRYAIVEGDALYPGERWREMELIEIRAGSVLFRHNDNEIEVTLRQGKTLTKGKANGF
ncbi:hypothetical protein [Lacimicrobium alkaliphilum]|uniref:MSHA biogenesis protein MshK n=1 Tax=Lacimicrobium alkaliphilum TaxID=1526571 RepID=A0ABQ1R859_9ALTE|nr:hypothetical protein [Lacimicrobium alkaliphilum]GGD61844.1 hypothetical protein GCM10011357_16390 [Lacimicrobium alkaliphilum]